MAFKYSTDEIPHICASLITASQVGHKTCTNALVQLGSDVNQMYINDCTAILHEAKPEHAAIVRKVLDDRYAQSDEYSFALMHAATSPHRKCVMSNLDNIEAREGATLSYAMKAAITCLRTNNESKYDYFSALSYTAELGHVGCVEALLSHGAKVNHLQYAHHSALMPAAENGHAQCLEAMLQVEKEVNITDKESNTPLMLAAQRGHVKCVQTLLNAPEVAHTRRSKYRALESAAENGHIECVRALKEAGVDLQVQFSLAPLKAAVSNGHLGCVQALIEAGADVNIMDSFGHSPLRIAAESGQVECLKALVEAGADVNSADELGLTPLMYAAKKGHVQCLKELLLVGAEVNRLGPQRYTALLIAVKYDSAECAVALLDHGAAINCTSQDLCTPLLLAANNNHWPCVLALMPYGPEVDVQDMRGCTPLMHCVRRGHVKTVKALLSAGADVTLRNIKQHTAVTMAAFNHDAATLGLLLDSNPALVNATWKVMNGRPLMHFFVKMGNLDLVKLLLEKGADVDALDHEGQSPLMWAVRSNNGRALQIVKYLIRYGADLDVGVKESALMLAFNVPKPIFAHMIWSAGSDYNGCFGWNSGDRIPFSQSFVGIPHFEFSPNADSVDIFAQGKAQAQELLGNICAQPRPLLEAARRTVRKAMGNNLERKLKGLPLPTMMKDYLNIPELDMH